MRLPLLISLSLLFLTAQAVRAQFAPADDFFNSGAQFYISNNIPSALEQVEAGLKIYPDDEKLKKLEELLKQQQQQQDQKNNSSKISGNSSRPRRIRKNGKSRTNRKKTTPLKKKMISRSRPSRRSPP